MNTFKSLLMAGFNTIQASALVNAGAQVLWGIRGESVVPAQVRVGDMIVWSGDYDALS
jgi:hypothetical protein